MKLVDEWWTVLKGKSVNYVTLAVNVISAHALVFMAVLPFAPFYVQLPLAVGIALVASAPTWLASVWKQPKLMAKVEEKKQEKTDGVV